MSQTALEYIASLRAQGHRDVDLARALGEAGWTDREARRLLAGREVGPRGLPLRARLLLAVGAALLICLVGWGLWREQGRGLAQRYGGPGAERPGLSGHPLPPSQPRSPDPAQARRWEEMANRPVGSGPAQLTAALQLTGAPEVWVGSPFTVQAQGSYDLPRDLARALLNGSARLQEDYAWTRAGGFQAPGGLQRDTERTLLFPYEAFQSGDLSPEATTTEVHYTVTVTALGNAQPPFATQQAEAQASCRRRVASLRVHLARPTDQTALVTEPHDKKTFLAEITAEPGARTLPDAAVTWTFGDGATARGNPVTHAYRRRGSFWAVCAVDVRGQQLEVWLPVHVGVRVGARLLGPAKGQPGPTKPYQLRAPGN